MEGDWTPTDLRVDAAISAQDRSTANNMAYLEQMLGGEISLPYMAGLAEQCLTKLRSSLAKGNTSELAALGLLLDGVYVGRALQRADQLREMTGADDA